MALSDRLRPGVEATPWVIEQVKKLERELETADWTIELLEKRVKGLENDPHACIDNCMFHRGHTGECRVAITSGFVFHS